jgi:phage shock protein C
MTDTSSPQPPSSPGQPPYRALRRSRTDRMIGGVCAGIANYLRVDPVVVRVGFAVLAVLTWGTALLAYVLCWIVMPEEP